MAIAYVRSASNVTNSSVSSLTASFSGTPTVGNLVVVAVTGETASLGCSDNQSNTYTQIGSTVTCGKGTFATQGYIAYFYSIITATVASLTITGSNTDSSSHPMSVAIHEYSGVASSSPVDVFALGHASETTTSVTPKYNGSLIFASAYADSTGSGPESAIASPFTLRQKTGNFGGSDGNQQTSADDVQITAGAITGTFSGSGGAVITTSVIVFKRAGIYTAAGTFTWTAPTGVTSVQAEVWGGGGAGGPGWSSIGGDGGGGGAYSKKNVISVTPGTGYTVVVGAGGPSVAGNGTGDGTAGGDSSFVNSATVFAKGGAGGIGGFSSAGTGGSPTAGGLASGGVGDVKNNGGKGGGSGGGTTAGGSGGSGGSGGAGGDAVAATAGTAGTGGGAAGQAGTTSAGLTGNSPGAGGSGGGSSLASGAGAPGQVILTYTAGGTTDQPALMLMGMGS